MAIQTSFTIKQVNVDQALKKAEKKAENTAKKIDNTLNKADNSSVAKNIKELNKGASVFGGSFGSLGKLAGSVASKFALIGSAIALAGKAIKTVWDGLTLSEQEFLMKQEAKIKMVQQRQAQKKTQNADDNSYLSRLQQLSNAENVSNTMKQEAIRLVEILTKRYGNLGIQIDKVTGQITGLDEAQNKMLKIQTEKMYSDLEEEFNLTQAISDKRLKKTIIAFHERMDPVKMQSFMNDFGTAFFGGSLLTPNSAAAYNQISALPLKKQLDVMKVILEEAKTSNEIEFATSVIESLQKQIKLQQRLNNLKQMGFDSEKGYAQYIKNKSIKDKVAQNQNIQVQEGRKQTNIDDAMLQMQEQADYQKLTKTSQQLIFLQKKLNQEKQKHKNLSSAVAEIQGRTYDDEYSRRRDKIRISDIQKRIDKLKELQKQGIIIPPEVKQLERLQKQLGNLQTKIYPHDQERSNALAAISKLETQIKQNEKQQLKIKIQIQKLEEKSNKFYEDRIRAYDDELAVQKLILQGKFQQAQKQRLINQLNQQGLKINEKKIKQDEAKRKELAQVNADIQLQNDAKRLLDKYSPKTKDYRIQKRIEQIEESNKVKLTDEQKGKVKSLVEAEIKLEKLQIEKPNLSRYQIQTNELTARGGFQGGAVAFGKEQVNTEIKNYAAKQTNLLSQIKSILQNGGLI